MDAARSTSASKKKGFVDSHSLCQRLAARVFDDWAAMGVKDEEDRAALHTLALAEVRRPSAWLFPGGVILFAAVALTLLWLVPDAPWNDPERLPANILVTEFLLAIPVLLVAAFLSSEHRGVGRRLEEIGLTGMSPRLIALSTVSGHVAIWGVCCVVLWIVQSVLIAIRLACPDVNAFPSFSWWELPVWILSATVTSAALAWFHLESIRLVIWGSTAFLLRWPRARRSWRAEAEFMVGHFLGGGFCAGAMFLLIFAIASEGWFSISPARVRAGASAVDPLVQLFLCSLTVLSLSLFLRLVAGAGVRQFDLGWHAMDWRGLAEPDAPMPEHFRVALREWTRYLEARDAVEDKRDNDFLTRWKARIRCARYRWFRANTTQLSPDSHRFVGWGPFRREFVKPDDDLTLEPPPVPLPFEPNPARAFGTPVGGPTRLESPRGSFVSAGESGGEASREWETPESLVLPKGLYRGGRLGLVLSGLLLIAALTILLVVPEAHTSPDLPPLPSFHRRSSFQLDAGSYYYFTMSSIILTLLCLVFLGMAFAASWWLRRRLVRALTARRDIVFSPRNQDPIVYLEEGRALSLPSIVPPCHGFLRATPGFLEIEAERFHARLRSDEVRLQVQESPIACALLVSADFDDVTWAVSVRQPMTWTRFLPLLSTRRTIRRWREKLKKEMQISEYPAPAATPCRSCGR